MLISAHIYEHASETHQKGEDWDMCLFILTRRQ